MEYPDDPTNTYFDLHETELIETMSVDMWMDYFTHTVSPSVPDLYSIIIISIMESRVKVVKLGDQCAHKGIHDEGLHKDSDITEMKWTNKEELCIQSL